MFSKAVIAAAAATLVAAQRPEDTPICDFYTEALLMENNATNQQTLLTLLVNTAVIGNYTQPNVAKVDGILNPNATFNGVAVNLVPYFDGTLVSTNAGGSARSVNFLDDGGAAPLMENKPANTEDSAQFRLLTHLYSYFGVLLGCTMVGEEGFPAYGGSTSQYDVHRFMALDANEVGYFISQVGASAASFGVAEEDVAAVGMALNDAFGMRCSAPAAIPPTAEPELQAICITDDCPLAANATCPAYDAVMAPMSTSPAMGNATSTMPTGTMTTGTASSTAPAEFTGAANARDIIGYGAAAAAAGACAFAL